MNNSDLTREDLEAMGFTPDAWGQTIAGQVGYEIAQAKIKETLLYFADALRDSADELAYEMATSFRSSGYSTTFDPEGDEPFIPSMILEIYPEE